MEMVATTGVGNSAWAAFEAPSHLRPPLLSFEAPLKSIESKVVTAFITSLVGGEKPTKVEFLSADNVLKTEEEEKLLIVALMSQS